MSYAAHRKDFATYTAKPEACAAEPRAKTGFWRYLSKAFGHARRSHADRQIGRFIEGRGGHLTDELEREIMRHMSASPHYWRML